MKRTLYVRAFLPAWALTAIAFRLLSMFVDVTEATARETRPETPLPVYALSYAQSDVTAAGDTIDLAYSEPVNVPDVKQGGGFEETAAFIYGGYFTFTNESMDESYGPGWLAAIGGVGWGRRLGGSIELGFMG